MTSEEKSLLAYALDAETQGEFSYFLGGEAYADNDKKRIEKISNWIGKVISGDWWKRRYPETQAILCYGITENCVNDDSYGCICVRCNKCGRFKEEEHG